MKPTLRTELRAERRFAVVEFAEEILAMHREIIHLRDMLDEEDHWRKKYSELLNSNLDNQRQIMGTMLGAVLDPDSHLNQANAALIEKQTEEPTK